MLHNEGLLTRNYTSYNFQVLRDDTYILGVDGTVTGHRIAPARSSCAILVSSQNANREWLYYTQQTSPPLVFPDKPSAPSFRTLFAPRKPSNASDCHVSAANDNNAWMAQLLLQGTNFMNFMGRYIYVATGNKGLEAVAVAEHDEPEAIYGSDLQRIAYPENYKSSSPTAAKFPLSPATKAMFWTFRPAANTPTQLREPAACASMTSPISITKVFPSASPPRPSRRSANAFFFPPRMPSPSLLQPRWASIRCARAFPENEEQAIHLLYGFLYVADKEEGLVIVGNPDLKSKSPGVGTLLDGDPTNNFLKRGLAFNPGGALTGARRITIAGTFAYILTDKALVVVDLDNPLAPKITATIGAPFLNDPRAIAVQFRYAFVVDHDGIKVLEVTDLAQPKQSPKRLCLSKMPGMFTLPALTPTSPLANKASRSST